MLGWEVPPFISGGLGVHCFELTKSTSEMGIYIDFYMPSNLLPFQKVRTSKLSGSFPVDYSSFEGEIDFADAEFGPYFKFLKMREAGATEVGGIADTDKESYGLNFFEAVGRYNFLVAQACFA